jgi:hypothetical protein
LLTCSGPVSDLQAERSCGSHFERYRASPGIVRARILQ